MSVDKKALLAMVSAALNGKEVPASTLPVVYDGVLGDQGDQGQRAEEGFRAEVLASMAQGLGSKKLALQAVDPSPAAVGRVGALVRVLVIVPDVVPQSQVFFILPFQPFPCSFPGFFVISDMSPVGASLLGRVPGEVVRSKTPRGVQEMKILEVE